jgi:hypothetical protein
MELDFAFLADSAQVVNGRLFVLGGALDRLWAPQVPVVHPLMTLAMRFQLSVAELDREHQLEVVLIDGDGKHLSKVGGKLKVGRRVEQELWKPAMPLLTINLVNTKFERFGSYAIEILVNGTSLKSLPLELVERKQPVQQQVG